jgi:hypothetical protein
MRMQRSIHVPCLWIALCGAATAQAPPAAKPPAEIAPPVAASGSKDCAPMQPASRQGSVAPEGSTTGQSREPLSDKLAKSDGVLCPPSGVDPEIRMPTPDVGNTPVIPPPGSPGGDPTVRPK